MVTRQRLSRAEMRLARNKKVIQWMAGLTYRQAEAEAKLLRIVYARRQMDVMVRRSHNRDGHIVRVYAL